VTIKRISRVIGSCIAAALVMTGCDLEAAPPAATPGPVPLASAGKALASPVMTTASKGEVRLEQAAPGANTLVEAFSPELGALEIQIAARGSGEVTRLELRAEAGEIRGAIVFPEESAADYSIAASDLEGRITHKAEGTAPALAQLDKPFQIPLHPVDMRAGDARDGIVLTLSREGIALTARESPEDPREWIVSADLFDARGEPLRFEPGDLEWRLLDERFLELRPYFEPRDIKVVVKKELPEFELCRLQPVVTACLPNGLCKPLRVCSDPWRQISAGSQHSCALTRSGAAFCWGLNTQGQLGAQPPGSCTASATAPHACHSRPLRVECPANSPCSFTQISAGETLTAALDVNGDVWWWGRGTSAHHRVDAMLAGSPVKFSMVAAGFGHACALSQSRQEIWCWGTNGYGEAGAPRSQLEVPDHAPVRVMVPLKFRKIVAGGEHTCAIGHTGYDVVCWGRDDQKQSSGPNSTQAPNTGSGPFYFQQFGGLTAIHDVAVSSNTTCVTLSYTVRCWGDNGWLNTAPFGSPDHLTVGFSHLCALRGLQASCMGANNWGELGIGSMAFQAAPVAVRAPPSEYADLSAGDSHTCGIDPAGDAFCWGRNTSGQVGNAATSYSVNAPVKVAAP
jgi:alpha-tubulin suppressor-like RCC1 family protein